MRKELKLILNDIDKYLEMTRILLDMCINTPTKIDLLASSVALDIKASGIVYKINNLDLGGLVYNLGLDDHIQPIHNVNLDIADLLHCLCQESGKIYDNEKLVSRTYAKIMKANYSIINSLLLMKKDINSVNLHLLN